jgi:hypothetical protein
VVVTLLHFLRTAFLSFTVLLAFLAAARSEDGKLAEPTGQVILTIEGNIAVTNGDGKARFDRDMLEAIGLASIETTTPWYDGTVTFEGVPAQRLMDMVGAQGTEIVAIALNDYRTTIPLVDFRQYGVILALKRNGEYMPVSDKGPVFVIYPYDKYPELQTQQYYARSAWQLARLIVR